MHRIIFTTLFLTVLFACREEDYADIPFDPVNGWFPQDPVNLSELNTRFDEYSGNITTSGMHIHLHYSTNYENKGANFDVDGAILELDVDEEQNNMSLKLTSNKPPYSNQLFPLINSAYDEHGPLSFNSNSGTDQYFFYAHNKVGQYEIEYTYRQNPQGSISGPFNAAILNSSVCDFYPTINTSQTQMIFSSYRGGKYDIYEIDIEGSDFVEWLNSGSSFARLNANISSTADDKCPCMNGNLLVFVSDRAGGYGACDLWYSEFRNNEWSKPVNFGPEINTEYDEFSPSITYFSESNNDLMLFSSNRPGGRGGYDFYFVGIPKLIR